MDIKAENLHEAVAILTQNRPLSSASNVPPPPPPTAVKSLIDSSQESRTGISLLVSMTYMSISGNMHSREILIRRVIQSKDDYYIDGVAMDKHAPRLIKFSHIRGIRDITSGKVYYNPYEFAQNRLGIAIKLPGQVVPQSADDFSRLIERTGQEMTVLMYLVAIDGQRDKSEREKVFQYIKSRTTDLKYDDTELMDYLISLAPDEQSFTDALSRVLVQDQTTVQGFVEAILDVMMADGRVDERERSFLIRIMDLLDQEGYDITLPMWS